MTAPAAEKLNVVVSAESVQEGDDALVSSNASIVNALLTELLTEEEIARNALRSYYVDFYLIQVLNGGFAQYIFNSGWKPEINERVLEGLNLMGADAHARLFEKAVAIFEELDADQKDFFLTDAFFEDLDEDLDEDRTDDPEQPAAGMEEPGADVEDVFDGIDEDFYALAETEDLVAKNAAWLRSLPELTVLPREELEDYVDRRVAEIPNLEERREAAARYREEHMPEFERTIRALAAIAGQELEAITIGDPTFEWEGDTVFAWHFTTDEGEYLMIEDDDEALMIDGVTREVVASVEFEDDGFDDGTDEDFDEDGVRGESEEVRR